MLSHNDRIGPSNMPSPAETAKAVDDLLNESANEEEDNKIIPTQIPTPESLQKSTQSSQSQTQTQTRELENMCPIFFSIRHCHAKRHCHKITPPTHTVQSAYAIPHWRKSYWHVLF